MKIDIDPKSTPQQRLLVLRAQLMEHAPALVELKRQIQAIERDLPAAARRGESLAGHVALLGQLALNLQADASHLTDLLAKIAGGPFSDMVRAISQESVNGVIAAAAGGGPECFAHNLIENIDP